MTTRSLVLFASLSLLAGCKTVHVLGPDQLQKLDGYDVTQHGRRLPQLETDAGELVSFEPGDALTFIRPGSRKSPVHLSRIQQIAVSPGLLAATLLGGRAFPVDLKGVTQVWLQTPSAWKTALLVVGSIVLGGAAIAGLGFLAVDGLHEFGRGLAGY